MLVTARFWLILWRYIRPEIEELIVYTIAVILFAITAAYEVIVKSENAATQDISEAIKLITDSFEFMANGGDTMAKLLTFGLWFIIGTFIYALAVFLVSFTTGALHKVSVAQNYRHPQNFRTSKYLMSSLSWLILRIAAAISLFIYTAVWCAVIAPAWLASFKGIAIEQLSTETMFDCGLAIIGIGLSLHIAAILIRLVLLKSSYMRSGV